MFLRSFSSQLPELFIFKCFAVGPHDSENKLFVASFDTDLFQPLCLQTSTSDPTHEDKTMGKLMEIFETFETQHQISPGSRRAWKADASQSFQLASSPPIRICRNNLSRNIWTLWSRKGPLVTWSHVWLTSSSQATAPSHD